MSLFSKALQQKVIAGHPLPMSETFTAHPLVHAILIVPDD